MAAVLHGFGGADAGVLAILLGVAAAPATGAPVGWLMGATIATTGAHPILVSLSMMIFVRGLGEFLTHGGDISGTPSAVQAIGQGTVLGVPAPILVFAGAVLLWNVVMSRTRLGFATRMIGSHLEATRYSGIPTRRMLTLIYTLSGLMCAIAGIVMLARFNSVRVGHGDAYVLITVLACFLGGVDPFGGFGRVPPVRHRPGHSSGDRLGTESARRQSAPGDCFVGRLPAPGHGRAVGLGQPLSADDVRPPLTRCEVDGSMAKR